MELNPDQFKPVWSPEVGGMSPEYGYSSPRALFHGSDFKFKPGDIINEGGTHDDARAGFISSEEHDFMNEEGYANQDYQYEKMVYAGTDPFYCKSYGDHIYHVEPVTNDLIHLRPSEIGSQTGFRVIHEVTNENGKIPSSAEYCGKKCKEQKWN